MPLIQSLLIIFTIISLGIFSEKRKIFNTHHIEAFEIFLFKIALPCYLFTATLQYDFYNLVNFNFAYSYILAFCAIALLIKVYFWQSNISKLCITILAAGYINSAIYALPIINFLLEDPKSAILANLIQVITIQPVFIAILSILHHKEKSMLQKLLTPILTPLVAMPLIGILCNYLQFMPHQIITTIVSNLGSSASSIALFTFGLSLAEIKIKYENINRELLFVILAKNILHPVFAFLIGKYIFLLDSYWLYSLVLATSSPTAFLVYLLAKQFSINQSHAKLTVALSSVFSLIMLIIIALTLGFLSN